MHLIILQLMLSANPVPGCVSHTGQHNCRAGKSQGWLRPVKVSGSCSCCLHTCSPWHHFKHDQKLLVLPISVIACCKGLQFTCSHLDTVIPQELQGSGPSSTLELCLCSPWSVCRRGRRPSHLSSCWRSSWCCEWRCGRRQYWCRRQTPPAW